MIDELPFKGVRSNGTDDVLARAVTLLIARGAYREAARIYPENLIELRHGARIIEKKQMKSARTGRDRAQVRSQLASRLLAGGEPGHSSAIQAREQYVFPR